MICGVILGSQNRSNLSWNLVQNGTPPWSDHFSHVEASGGGLGFDVGLILGSILGSRAPSTILAKISTAPRREHDFRGSGGVKKEPKMVPKPASSGNLARRATWELLGIILGAIVGPNENKLFFSRF